MRIESHTNEKTTDEPWHFHWCRITDVFQTITPDKLDSYKLNELVAQFHLLGELLNG